MNKKNMIIVFMTFAGLFGLLLALYSTRILVDETRTDTWVGVFFLIVAILIVVLSCVANFTIVWDEEKQKEDKDAKQKYLDTLEEVPVEEVN